MANSRNCESRDALRDTVTDCLRRHLSPDQHLAVGLSGGRDSVALLHVVHGLSSSLGFQLSACHVNHGISPKADAWQGFCESFCRELKVPLECVAVVVPRASPEGLEAAARAQRYSAFGTLGADWLLLGQHQDDQAETMLFNLLRGAGLLGASGMPEARRVRPGLHVLRPLLDVDRREIDAYLRRNDLPWVDDESNLDTGLTRNFMRHQVIPLLQSRFPAAVTSLAAAAGRFGEARVLLDELASLDLGGIAPSFPIPVTHLVDLPEPRARNLLRFLLAKHGIRIPSEERLIEGLRQLRDARADRHPLVMLGEGCLRRVRGEVHLEITSA